LSALFLFILPHPFLLFSSVAFRFDAPLFHGCRCGEEGDNEGVEIALDPPGIAVAPTALRSGATSVTFELVADPNAESPIRLAPTQCPWLKLETREPDGFRARTWRLRRIRRDRSAVRKSSTMHMAQGLGA